jgi:hypothetical protein
VAGNVQRRQRFLDAKVGLLGVTRRECKAVIPAQMCDLKLDHAAQLHAVEKFWTSRVKDIGA